MTFLDGALPKLNGAKGVVALVMVSVLASGGLVAGIVHFKKGEKAQARTGLIETNSGITPEFLQTTVFPEPAKEPEPEPTRELPPPPPPPATAPAIPPPPPPPAPRLTENQIFSNIKPLPRPEDDPATRKNAERRGHTDINFPNAMRDARIDWAHKDRAWREANTDSKWAKEEREEASLPVDMSRVVHAAKFIPAILINEINSELPGKIVASVEENVYGSHGRLVLIPGGSIAKGRYKPLTKQGEKRLAVIWERIILPDGINIHLEDAEMSDAMGRSGITGEIDSRFAEKYGMALFVSMLGAAAQTQIPVDNRAQGLAVEGIGNTSATMAKTILDKSIDLKPVVTIAQGSPVMISPQRDIWFKLAKDGKTVKGVEALKR